MLIMPRLDNAVSENYATLGMRVVKRNERLVRQMHLEDGIEKTGRENKV
jgi:hypothetical protein